MASKEKPF